MTLGDGGFGHPDHRVLSVIDGDRPRSQRDIARSAGLSLGSTNIAIKRLLEAGNLRVNRINRRRQQYILTPKGLAERTEKTLRAVERTMGSFASIKRVIQEEVLRVNAAGAQVFCIVGENSLAALADDAIKSLDRSGLRCMSVRRLDQVPDRAQAVLLTEPVPGELPTGRPFVDLPGALQRALFQ